MENALIVSYTDKSASIFSEILNAASMKQITVLHSAGEARRLLLEQDFDLVIVDAPLTDESGESFSRHIALKSLSQVIHVVKSEHFNAVSSVCEEDGILTISKPVNTEFFWCALSLAKSAGSRIKRIQAENTKLKQKIEDIRIIDRAKCLLISYLNLSEQESHRFIEKQAMDLRSSKRTIAEGIIKTYAS
ncbi:MAG: ANTAR domain-containing protein [Treponema sp.]|jgi:response regulator NasT|nr:ANTAR domain-containing protein [Treponema sp.]